jgi:hypothetical protein
MTPDFWMLAGSWLKNGAFAVVELDGEVVVVDDVELELQAVAASATASRQPVTPTLL